jgi:RNase H-fold protein (predicted Holliday junction resolvase)
MYSDDIWNLVITSKANNSSKSNRAISEEFIKKLKDRNNYLIDYTDEHYKL